MFKINKQGHLILKRVNKVNLLYSISKKNDYMYII